jgi:hypothetical protein
MKWVEKWAIFDTGFGSKTEASTIIAESESAQDPVHQYKYFCKFWHESHSKIKSECKLQHLDASHTLTKEVTEQSTLIDGTLSDLLSFTLTFSLKGRKLKESGVSHKLLPSDDLLQLELWETDHTTQVYLKETTTRR